MRESPGVIMPTGMWKVGHCRLRVVCIFLIFDIFVDSYKYLFKAVKAVKALKFFAGCINIFKFLDVLNSNNENKMKHADCTDVSEISNGCELIGWRSAQPPA